MALQDIGRARSCLGRPNGALKARSMNKELKHRYVRVQARRTIMKDD